MVKTVNIKTLPENVLSFINHYFHLQVCNIEVICPYFMNSAGGWMRPSVYAGKGMPEEIEYAAAKLLGESKKDKLTSDFIRSQMQHESLGIDCSGLVYQIFDYWLNYELQKGPLKQFIKLNSTLNPRKFLSRIFKNQSAVSADMFTSEPCSHKILVHEVRPGDLIRTRGGKHLLLITKVHYHNSIPVVIEFVNSTTSYSRNGVRYGEIILTSDLDLLKAEWKDNDPDEKINYAYKGYRELTSNNGLFRPDLPL